MPLLILFILDTFCLDNIRILLKALINSGISSDILEQAICITLSSLKDSNIKLINKIKAIVVRKEERLLEKKMKLTNLKPAPVVVDIISTLQKSSSEVFFNFSKILAPLNQLLNSKFTSCYQNFTLILNICDFLFAYVPNFQIDNSQSLLKLDESYDILDLASKFSDLIVEFSNTSKLLSQQHYLSALNHWSFICKLYFENYLDYNICEMDYLDKSFAMVFYIHFTFFDATSFFVYLPLGPNSSFLFSSIHFIKSDSFLFLRPGFVSRKNLCISPLTKLFVSNLLSIDHSSNSE